MNVVELGSDSRTLIIGMGRWIEIYSNQIIFTFFKVAHFSNTTRKLYDIIFLFRLGGIMNDVFLYILAIATHKFVITFCIGLELVGGSNHQSISTCAYIIYMVTFILVSPFGKYCSFL